jgi:hypothetical protein
MKNYSIKRLRRSSNKLIEMNGVTYYKTPKTQSSTEDQVHKEIYSDKKRKVDIDLLKNIISRGRIESPANKRPILSKNSIIFTNKKSDREINCFLSKSLSGLLFEESLEDVNLVILSVLHKYKSLNESSTWNYFSKKKDNSFNIYISLPRSSKELDEIVKVLTEIAESTKVFLGYSCKINIVLPRSQKVSFKQKEYSTSALIGLVLGRIALGTITSSMVESLSRKNSYSRDVERRLLGWAKKKKDLMVINLGDSSFYINKNTFEREKELYSNIMESGDSKNPRSIDDYLKKAFEQGKDLVVYSDINSSVVLAHELGHYLVSRKKFLRKIQDGAFLRILSRSDLLITFIAILLGLSGHFVASMLSALVLKSPTLISEFAASYYGLKLLKEVGCSEKDINKARDEFKRAYVTYLNGALGISLTGASFSILGQNLSLPDDMPDLI